jgi:sulfate adenylyltransferase
VADVEAILSGAFSPLVGFMGQRDHESTCRDLRLEDGTLFPLPITLDVSEPAAAKLQPGALLALRDPEGVLLAVLRVSETWRPDCETEARQLFGTTALDHPGVFRLLQETHPIRVAGRLEGVELPHHYDFVELRRGPTMDRERFARLGWRTVAAFHPEGVMHRAEQELTLAACRALAANLLIQHPAGSTVFADVGHYARVRCLAAVTSTYPRNTALLGLAPLVPRHAGAREVLLRAVVAQNHGCSHLIVRRRAVAAEAGARELLERHQEDLGIQLSLVEDRVHVAAKGGFLPESEAPAGGAESLSEAELKERLAWGREIPTWFSFPNVVRELRRAYPPRSRQGFTVFFSGLPSSGKSTVANALLVKLMEIGGRPVTILDGDIVRHHLSSELGFSREHRDINIRRIGFVASEITKNGGIAICAPIAPYDAVRKQVRAMIEPVGGFLLVHVATPLEVCEQRDRKGLYAKARAGIVKEFTGISDPYEVPTDAGLSLDTSDRSPEECVQMVVLHLEKEGFIGPTGGSEDLR